MALGESTLKKTKNYFKSTGYLYESGLKKEACKIKIKDDKGNPAGEVNGERILGRISIKTEDGIHEFNVFFNSLDSKGQPSQQWPMACKMMEWVPQINGSGASNSFVTVEGSVDINDYVRQNGEISSTLRWRINRANTAVDNNTLTGTTLTATAYINTITPEIINEKETGRLKVQFVGVSYNGTCIPMEVVVDAEQADDFTDGFEIGQTVEFDFSLVSRHVGGAPAKAKRAFGKKEYVDTSRDYDVLELKISGVSDPIEEPDEKYVEDNNGNMVEVPTEWINPIAMRKALKERAKMLEEMKKNPPEKKSGSGGSGSGSSFGELKKKNSAPSKKPSGELEFDFNSGDDPF